MSTPYYKFHIELPYEFGQLSQLEIVGLDVKSALANILTPSQLADAVGEQLNLDTTIIRQIGSYGMPVDEDEINTYGKIYQHQVPMVIVRQALTDEDEEMLNQDDFDIERGGCAIWSMTGGAASDLDYAAKKDKTKRHYCNRHSISFKN